MLIEIDMKKILTRMNPCICSTTAVDRDWLFDDTTNRSFNNQLHTIDLRKLLPSAILCAVVADVEEITQRV